MASEFAAGPLFWFQQRRVRAPPGTRGQSCSPALTREPRRPPSRVPGRSPGQGRRSGVPFPWCRRMTLCDLGPGLDVLVSGSRASLWVEMLPASQRGAWGEVQKALSAPQDAASGGHCHTVVTVHFLRPVSDALSRGIQRAWRSASPGPGGSHCSRPEHSCGSRAVLGSWPGGGPTLCSVHCPRTAPHAEQILRKRERRQPFPRGGRSLFTWKVPGRGQCPISQEGAPHPLSHPPFLASLTDWTVLGQKQSKPRDHQSTPFELC